jgi:glycosyltransferase involved in cell wall biosynthesis
VCIPVYNGAEFLEETLASVCGQKGVTLEIVVSDDQSTDDSLRMIRRFESRHSELKWIVLQSASRLGMAKNWNACLSACTHDFVKVMGQDDLLRPGALFAQSALLMEYPNVALAAAGCDILNRHGARLFKRPRRRPTGIYDGNRIIRECLAIRGNAIGEPVTAMARKVDFLSVGGFSDEQRYFIDLDLWFRLLKDRDFGWMSDSQAGFRIHGRAVSSSSQHNDFDQFDSLPFAADYAKSLHPLQRSLRKNRARCATTVRNLIYRSFG